MNTVRKTALMLVAVVAAAGLFPAHSAAKAAQATSCQQFFEDAKARGATIVASKTTKNISYFDGFQLRTPDLLVAALKSARAASQHNLKDPLVLIGGGNFDGWAFKDIPTYGLPICFYKSSLTGTNWEGAEFPGMGFFQSDLTSANFQKGRLSEAIFHDSTLKNVTMRAAYLKDGRFSGGWGASVADWDLGEADMTGFRFHCGITVDDGCPLDRDGINFARANLKKADVSSFLTWGDADFGRAVFNSTVISPQQIPHLVGITIKGKIVVKGGNERSYLTGPQFDELQALAKAVAEERSEPSFQCFDARTRVEKMICGEYEHRLRRLDRQMAELYTNRWPHHSADLQTQRDWLKKRNACEDTDCIKAAYTKRIDEVLAASGEPSFLKLGESAYFIPDTIGIPRGIVGSSLYERLVPPIAGEAMASVRVTMELDGSYSIIGQAVGANAHICSLGGSNLVFDDESGWFSSTDKKGNSWPLFQIIGDELTIFKSGRFVDSRPEDNSAYVSCGARASFPSMQRVFYDNDKLAALIAFADEPD